LSFQDVHDSGVEPEVGNTHPDFGCKAAAIKVAGGRVSVVMPTMSESPAEIQIASNRLRLQGVALEAMPESTATPALEAALVDRGRQIERTKQGLVLLSLATLLLWIREIALLGLAIGAIAVVLILVGASAFGSRHSSLAWTSAITFVIVWLVSFGLVASLAGTIRSLPTGASGPETASKVLAAFDTTLYALLVVVSILSICSALIAFGLEDRLGRLLLCAGVAAQIAVSVSIFVFVLIPLVHRAIEQTFAVTPPDMSIITAADAQVRSLRGLAVLNSIPAVLFAGAYLWAYRLIARGETPSPRGAPSPQRL
jgi:hypothetical protein